MILFSLGNLAGYQSNAGRNSVVVAVESALIRMMSAPAGIVERLTRKRR
jgi:hypothetical protein